MQDNHEKVLVLDFGGQYNQLIARRVREHNVYAEIKPYSRITVDEIKAAGYVGVIFTGGPNSVYDESSPHYSPEILDAGIPVLGICYGFQAMAYALGADVDKAALGEYGKTETTIDKAEGLLDGSPAEQSTWMSHGVAVKTAPEGFEVLAHTEGAPVAAMQDESRKLYGVQWHPEVKHTPMGQKLIENFLHKCAGLGDNWNASNIIEDQVKKIREKVGDAQVICGLSGGVDSVVFDANEAEHLGRIGSKVILVRVETSSSPACSWTTVCCARARPSRSSMISSRPPASSSSPWTPPKTSSPH